MAINSNTVNLSDNDTEKATELQQNYVGTLRDLPPDPDAHLPESERALIDRKLVWKLDLVMIPWLSLLYLLAFLDRTNIGNAKIAGLGEDLHMNTQQYNDTLTIFFISYALFEPLTNILLKRLRPSIFIPIIMYVTQAHVVPLLCFLELVLTLVKGAVGRVHGWYGLCPRLVWTHGCPVVPRSHRSGFISRNQLLPVLLVQEV